MHRCETCGQERDDAISCLGQQLIMWDGRTHLPIPFGQEGWGVDVPEPCGGCGVHLGGFHHPGCEVERCPCCGGRLLTCGCVWLQESRQVGEAPEPPAGYLLFFPGRDRAQEATDVLRARGYSAGIWPVSHGPIWLVLVSSVQPPASGEPDAISQELADLTASFGGEYHGWEDR